MTPSNEFDGDPGYFTHRENSTFLVNKTLYKKIKDPHFGGPLYNLAPCYFPTTESGSIVTAARLNCCVRNGNRCFPSAMGTNQDELILIQSEWCPYTATK